MKRTIIQGLLLVLLFFAIWFVLTQIDWLEILKVEKEKDRIEEKLGEFFLEAFEKNEIEIRDPIVVNSLDSILTKVCSSNEIDKESIKIHVLNREEINAFAIPNGHLIVYSGLILNAQNQEELSGVICHEIAHIQLNHVMKKLVKEIGLSALISITTGNGGAEIIKMAAKTLSSSAFDRNLEKEADMKAVDYLVEAKINPEPFGNFLYSLMYMDNEGTKYLTWISSHPDSKERAEYVIEYAKNKTTTYEPVLSPITWERLKDEIQ